MKTLTQSRRSVVYSLILSAILVMGVLPFSAHGQTVCTPITINVVSDTTTLVDGEGQSNAQVSYTSPHWTTIPGAQWIWKTALVQNPNSVESVTFQKNFTVNGSIASSTLSIAGDDYFKVYLNGTEIASEFGEGNFLTAKTYTISPSLFSTNNVLRIEAQNAAYFYSGEGTVYNNPAGIIYSLTVDSSTCTTTPQQPTGGTANGTGYVGTTTPNNPSNPNKPKPVTTTIIPKVVTPHALATGTTATTTIEATTTDAQLVVAKGPAPLAAAAFLGMPGNLTEAIYCTLIAIIALIILYIIWLFLGSDKEKGLTTKKALFFLITAVLASVILFVLGYACAILPLVILTLILLGGFYFEIL
jgi:hypothetical protein